MPRKSKRSTKTALGSPSRFLDTKEKKQAYFELVIKNFGDISLTARQMGMHYTTPYKLAEKHPDFAAEWADAVKQGKAATKSIASKAKQLAAQQIDYELTKPEEIRDVKEVAALVKMGGEVSGEFGGTRTNINIDQSDNRQIRRTVVYSPQPDLAKFDVIDLDRLDDANIRRQAQIAEQNKSAAGDMREFHDRLARERADEIKGRAHDKTVAEGE